MTYKYEQEGDHPTPDRIESTMQVDELRNLHRRVAELEEWKEAANETIDMYVDLLNEQDTELAALKQQGDSVAWMHTSGNACYCGKDLKIDGYTIPLYTAPPACFSAGDMAEAAAKALKTGKGAVDCNECVNRGKYVDPTGAIMGEVTFCEMCEHFRRVNYFKRSKQE